jgi:hypothetical protein
MFGRFPFSHQDPGDGEHEDAVERHGQANATLTLRLFLPRTWQKRGAGRSSGTSSSATFTTRPRRASVRLRSRALQARLRAMVLRTDTAIVPTVHSLR